LAGFISTSTNKQRASGFRNKRELHHYTYFITYIVSPGIPVLSLKHTMINEFDMEDEVLLPRGLVSTLVSKNTFYNNNPSIRHLIYRLSLPTKRKLLPLCTTYPVLSVQTISEKELL
jgi:hypothetical protein